MIKGRHQLQSTLKPASRGISDDLKSAFAYCVNLVR